MATQRYRGNHEGTVYEQPKPTVSNPTATRWAAAVVVDGKRHIAYSKTAAEAKKKLRALTAKADSGTTIIRGDITLADLLDDWSRKALPNRNLTEAAIANHHHAITALNRHLGTKKLRDLTPEHVEAAFAKEAADGKARATLAKRRTTLRMALAWAERRGVIARNIGAVVELPAEARKARPGRSMSTAEAQAFINAARGTKYEAMWLAQLYLGLRPGEAAALSWDDIDFTNGIIHVRHGRTLGAGGAQVIGATKTPQSVRSCDAPPALMAALKAHRSAQAVQRLECGSRWLNADVLVFTSATGNVADPSKLRKEFDKVCAAAGIGDDWSPNLLRHTAASLMSDAGIPIEELADQFGHKDTRMLSQHYRHRVRPTVSGGNVMGRVLSIVADVG